MKHILMINYDLNAPGKNYKALYDEIQKRDNCHPLDSCWLVYTDESIYMLEKKCRQHLDNNDGIIVSEFSSTHQGWVNPQVWEWVNSRSLVSSW